MIPGEDANHLPEDVRAAVAGLEAMLGPTTPEAVACGIVVRTWREAVEDFHALLTQAEMAYANVATTRAIMPHSATDQVDWKAVRRVLTEPDRPVLPDRSAQDVLGQRWQVVQALLHGLLDRAEVLPPSLLASYAKVICPRWWGMPGWATLASSVAASGRVTGWHRSPQDLTELLVADPTQLDFDVWAQVVLAVAEADVDR